MIEEKKIEFKHLHDFLILNEKKLLYLVHITSSFIKDKHTEFDEYMIALFL